MENNTPIIGLEVHVELTTKSKMFCGCAADHFGKTPNTQTCPVCLGLPGALPVPNKKAIEDTIMIGLALNCQIAKKSHFDRKQYFYPDLPKGYQISQYDQPFCFDGFITLDSGNKIGIERVHLEEDTAKLQHKGTDSLIDFNRSGVPLVEIVSKPEMSSSEEAKEYLKKIYQLVTALRVSTADMEKGQMRLEPTVNVKIGNAFTPLVELKNINSFNFVAAAIEFEVKRLTEEFKQDGLDKTKKPKATRGYDSVKKITFPQREKEEAKDYRYFPEPDIPPFEIDQKMVEEIKKQLPELPSHIKARLVETGLRADYAEILINSETLLALGEELIREALKQEVEANKIIGAMINGKVQVEGRKAEDIVKEIKGEEKKYLSENELEKVVEMVVSANKKVVEDYKKGKTNSIQFLLGQVMRSSQGMAKAEEVMKILAEKLR